MELIAKATALVGGTVAYVRRMGSPAHQAFGAKPDIPEARAQGIMTLKMLSVPHSRNAFRCVNCFSLANLFFCWV